MSKAVLVIDFPESCGECRLCSVIEDFRCMGMPRDCEEAYFDQAVVDGVRDDACPLRALPEPRTVSRELEGNRKKYMESYVNGWNDCIADLLGISEEQICTDSAGSADES